MSVTTRFQGGQANISNEPTKLLIPFVNPENEHLNSTHLDPIWTHFRPVSPPFPSNHFEGRLSSHIHHRSRQWPYDSVQGKASTHPSSLRPENHRAVPGPST